MAASDRSDRAILVIGTLLLAAYLAQARLELEWAWLAHQQANETYKVISGLVLGLYVYFQWSVGMRRQFDPARAVFRHKLGGALAPLVLYFHASRFAYGYLFLLGMLYLGMVFLGLLHRPIVRAHVSWLFTWWFVIHVATALILIVLGGYHVVIALAYE